MPSEGRGSAVRGTEGRDAAADELQPCLAQATTKAGVEGLRFHDLRHTANTMAVPGPSTRELMRRMGHASTRAAMIYQHASDDRDRVIADTLGAAIEPWHHRDDDEGPAGVPAPV